MDSPKKCHQNPQDHPHYSGPAVGVPVEQPSPSLGPWSTGLFDCFDDFNTCCLTFWCPCVAVGRVSEIVTEGVISCGLSGTLCTLLTTVCVGSCCYTAWIRCKMRGHHMLAGELCNDCCIHCFCQACAICQEYRELVNRGYDMSLGWEGNVERHKRMTMAMMRPPVEPGMVRC